MLLADAGVGQEAERLLARAFGPHVEAACLATSRSIAPSLAEAHAGRTAFGYPGVDALDALPMVPERSAAAHRLVLELGRGAWASFTSRSRSGLAASAS